MSDLLRSSRSVLAPEDGARSAARRPVLATFVPTCAIAFGLLLSVTAPQARAADLDFDRDIRPILQRRCFECHGAEEQSSGLRLDLLPSLKAGGDSGPAIDLDNPEASLVVRALRHDDEVSAMPPEGSPLAEEDIAKIETWIRQGAPGNETTDPAALAAQHWAFQPIRNPALPPVKLSSWIRNPIDAFILARLEKENITPSAEADRSTLLRRMYLDLIGLPPSPDELAAFLLDNRPDAYEQVVARLLASPHYGERWGRHWLDQARYADSNGYTIDGPRQIWKYRDWVIEATNQNQPFDQFIIEQLAGDLLPDATLAQRVATGFHRNTMINEEGGTDKEQFRIESMYDRLSTTGEVLLGLTLGCAQCHSHKFDPISQREYYQLFAFFNNADEPAIPVPTPEEQAAIAAIDAKQIPLRQSLKARETELAQTQSEWESQQVTIQQSWQPLAPTTAASAGGAEAVILPDHSVRISGTNAASDIYTIVATTDAPSIRSIKLEVLTDPSLPKSGPGRASNGNFIISEVDAAVTPFGAPGAPIALSFSAARAEHSQPNFSITQAIDKDPKTGWAINTSNKQSLNRDRVALLDVAPTELPAGKKTVVVRIHHLSGTAYNVGRFRLSINSNAEPPALVPAAIAQVLETPAAKRSKDQKKTLREWYFEQDEKRTSLAKEIATLGKQKPTPVTTMVFAERKMPRNTFVHIRGDFLRHGDQVTPDVPKVLPPLPPDIKRDRLAFARWLFVPEHPLTARVAVNRVWMEYFGIGLVETENDFGTMGSLPSHPELLDWLANWFRESGWDRKALHHLIVTSATYRQASIARPELDSVDPRNLLLARQNRLRVDAEIVRDIALEVSGKLSHKIGGPSVFPYQPDGVMALAQVKREWKLSPGEDRYRRGMYTYFWRSTPHPFLKVFDAPDAQRCSTRRSRSNTPLQSLTLLNDQSMVECAEGLADRLLDTSLTSDQDRIQHAYRLCVSRDPTATELDTAAAFLRDFPAMDSAAELAEETRTDSDPLPGTGSEAPTAPQADSEATAQRRKWVAFARAMLNLDELITRE